MSRRKILASEQLPLPESEARILDSYAEVKTLASPTEENLCREVTDADLLMVVYAKVTPKVINSATKLKGIVRCGIGVDNIDIQAATTRRIPVVNVPDYAVETVAEHAFALLISLARKVTLADKSMKSRKWGVWTSPSQQYRGIDLNGKTLGLVGLGRIGRALAERAEAFRMNLVAFDPYVDQGQLTSTKIKLTTLETLLSESDFISIHAALTNETKGLIGEKQLRTMKKTAYIINTSRGPIIDERSLVLALKEGWLAGAGLDVFEHEPPELSNPLFDLENVILTPHIAWFTEEAMHRLGRIAVERAIELLEGKVPKTVLNPIVFK